MLMLMLIMTSFFVGVGPGSPKVTVESLTDCVLGSSYGGRAPQSKMPEFINLKTFQGGSGGDFIFSLSVFCLFFYLSFLLKPTKHFGYHRLCKSKGTKNVLVRVIVLKSDPAFPTKGRPH